MAKKIVKPKKMFAGGAARLASLASRKASEAVQAANSPQPPTARGRGFSRLITSAVNAGRNAVQAANSPQPDKARRRGFAQVIGSAVDRARQAAVGKAKGGSVTKKPKKKV